MNPKQTRWLRAIAVLAVVTGAGLWAVFDKLYQAGGPREPAAEPLIVAIDYGDIEDVVATTGTLELPEAAGAAGPAADGRLLVASAILQTEAATVAAATDVYVTTLRGRDRRWHGSLADIRLFPAGSDTGTGYRVQFGIDNADGALEPGQSVQVFFVATLARNVLTVPLGALSFAGPGSDAGRASVRVQLPDGSIESREIVVGVRNRIGAQIVSGLEAGDRVVAGTILPPVEYDVDDPDRGPRDFRDRLLEPAPRRP